MQASGDETALCYPLLCTLCRLQQAVNIKPKSPGYMERTVCESCWRSTLDLSICWACGEYVMQGDRAVNLGLCFWHSSCFGCLLCGTSIGLPGPEGRERLELESIPHCKRCEEEIEEEGQNKKISKSYSAFSKADEGSGTDRIDISGLCGYESSQLIATSTRSEYKDVALGPLTNDDDHANCKSISELTLLADNVTDMGFTMSKSPYLNNQSHQSQELHISENKNESKANAIKSDIYLTTFSPLDEASFSPCSLIPALDSMHSLPKNLRQGRERKPRLVTPTIAQRSEEVDVYHVSKYPQDT